LPVGEAWISGGIDDLVRGLASGVSRVPALGSKIAAFLYCVGLPGRQVEICAMLSERFDLNDIRHEPTDEQLEALMKSVSVEAIRRATLARQNLMQRLREEIAAAHLRRATA
jgi:hypothetical protein